MKRALTTLALGVALLALLRTTPADEPPKPRPTAPVEADVQDFVFLGEARPVLVRLHVRADGKTGAVDTLDFNVKAAVGVDPNAVPGDLGKDLDAGRRADEPRPLVGEPSVVGFDSRGEPSRE